MTKNKSANKIVDEVLKFCKAGITIESGAIIRQMSSFPEAFFDGKVQAFEEIIELIEEMVCEKGD